MEPRNRVKFSRSKGRVTFKSEGIILASATNVLMLSIDNHTPRHCFEAWDINSDVLFSLQICSRHPFTGTQEYYGMKNSSDETRKVAIHFLSDHPLTPGLKGQFSFIRSEVEMTEE